MSHLLRTVAYQNRHGKTREDISQRELPIARVDRLANKDVGPARTGAGGVRATVISPVEGDPHTAWQVAPGESWFFNNGRLMAVDVEKTPSPVSSEDFVGKEGRGCDGHLSEVEPRRFLAVCVGTHWYSDGMFDAIFGFSRVVLFDVSTKTVIKRIDGPALSRQHCHLPAKG